MARPVKCSHTSQTCSHFNPTISYKTGEIYETFVSREMFNWQIVETANDIFPVIVSAR